jgi:protein tyrosine phosphatase (PTP) superfamily phosphohydrolase (DUF442 family)
MKRIRVRLLIYGALLVTGCAMRPPGHPTQTWAPPCDTCIVDVPNFGKISPTLWRGAQPTAKGFKELERAGVKTILSLREDHDDFQKLEATNLKYLRIPMHAWDPEKAQLVVLMKELDRILKDPNSTPVFIHCLEGKDRTGYSAALYRIVYDQWTPDDAIREMFDFRFNAIWFRNPAFLRRVDVKGVRDLIDRAP